MVVIEVQACGPGEAVAAVLDDGAVDSELDTVVHRLADIRGIAVHTCGRRKVDGHQQVFGKDVVVLEATAQAAVEEAVVDTEVPGL